LHRRKTIFTTCIGKEEWNNLLLKEEKKPTTGNFNLIERQKIKTNEVMFSMQLICGICWNTNVSQPKRLTRNK